MLRLLSHIFGWHYEPCKGCDVLRVQLEIKNAENKELLSTLLILVKPQVIEQLPKELQHIPTNPAAMTFSRRRVELEKAERTKAHIVKTSPFLAKPDEVVEPSHKGQTGVGISADQLEKELEISPGEKETINA